MYLPVSCWRIIVCYKRKLTKNISNYKIKSEMYIAHMYVYKILVEVVKTLYNLVIT